MVKWYYSGICKCDHLWSVHELRSPTSQRALLMCEGIGQPPYNVPLRCEAVEDMWGDDPVYCDCKQYVDRDELL